jgi:hypothetical protein
MAVVAPRPQGQQGNFQHPHEADLGPPLDSTLPIQISTVPTLGPTDGQDRHRKTPLKNVPMQNFRNVAVIKDIGGRMDKTS